MATSKKKAQGPRPVSSFVAITALEEASRKARHDAAGVRHARESYWDDVLWHLDRAGYIVAERGDD